MSSSFGRAARRPSALIRVAAVLASAVGLGSAACSGAASEPPIDYSNYRDASAPTDIWDPLPEPANPVVIDDSEAFELPERPRDTDAGTPAPVDAGSDDAGLPTPTPACPPLGPGSLHIVELMIASRSGSGDDAEWLEVENPADCLLTVDGLRFLSPRGTTTSDSVVVAGPFTLGPRERFLIGGAQAPVAAGQRIARWTGGDVLKNSGDSVRLERESDAAPIDELSYPSFSGLAAGRSIAFPSDCPAEARASWQRWSGSFASFGETQRGTPYAGNDDVTCF